MIKSLRAAPVLALVSLLACGGQQDRPLEWAEFRDMAYREADTGMLIYNGDEIAENETQLREGYDRYLASEWSSRQETWAQTNENLIVNLVNGHDDKWSTSAAVNITYCVSSSSFGSRYSAVVNAMDSAAGAWEGTARVNFVHASAYDASCSKTSPTVFNVRMVRTNQYLARSFFPSTSRSGREILISTSSFGNISPWTLAGVLRHELGHTIGFRHEHTRPEAGTCFEDNNWRALTAYDSASVMHYPQCNGTNKGDLVLTSLDKQGAKLLYP